MRVLLALVLAVGVAAGQTHIYRSVQPGVTSAIGTSTGTLTISGSTATFSVEQPDSVGVGDAIQYDSDGNSSIDAICFIHSRTSGQVYTVKTAAGAAPTAVTGDEDWDIFRAYTSWSNWESGTENTGINATVSAFDTGDRNIVTATEVWNVAFYPGLDQTNVYASGWTTSTTYYIRFFTPELESDAGRNMRHAGVWTTQSYRIVPNTNVTACYGELGGGNANSRFEGLQFQAPTGNLSQGALLLTSSAINPDRYIDRCIIRGHSGTTSATRFNGITASNGGSSTSAIVRNCIIYDFTSANTTVDCGIQYVGGTVSATLNNTIVDCVNGVRVSASGNLHRAINTIVQGATDGFSQTGGGSWHADSDYNISNVASDAPGANSLQATLTFKNPAADDFHLADADAEYVGRDLSGYSVTAWRFTVDVDGETRSNWNVGADEWFAEAVAGGTEFLLRRRTR